MFEVLFTSHRAKLGSNSGRERARLVETIIRKGGSDEGKVENGSAEMTELLTDISEEVFDNMDEICNSPVSGTPRIDPVKLEHIELELEQSVRVNTRSTALRQLALLLACTTQIRDLSNFSAMFVKNGGVAFLFAYFVQLILIGCPFALLELSIGQYTSLPACTLFGRIAPAFSGVSLLLLIVRLVYSLFVAMEPRYLIYSYKFIMQILIDNVEWLSCSYYPGWVCKESSQKCKIGYDSISGVCTKSLEKFESKNFSMFSKDTVMTYYTSKESQISFSPANIYSLSSMFKSRTDLCMASFIILCLAGCISHRGTKFFSKLCVFLCIFPLFAVIMLFVFSITNSGIQPLLDGFAPRWGALGQAITWMEAIQAAARTVGVGDGTLLTLGSLADFHNNLLRDVLLLALFGALIRIFAVATLVPVISLTQIVMDAKDAGSMIVQSSENIWSRLMFTALPGMQKDSDAHVAVCALFYLAMLTSMLAYQVVTLEICIGACVKSFPRILYLPDSLIRFCLITFHISSFTVLLGTAYYFDWTAIDNYMKYTLYLDAYCCLVAYEVLVISYGYGGRRLLVNLTTMCGKHLPRWGMKYANKLILVFWIFVLPIAVVSSALGMGLTKRFRHISAKSIVFGIVSMLPIYFLIRKVSYTVMRGRPVHTLFQTHRKWRAINIHNRRQAEHDERAARILF